MATPRDLDWSWLRAAIEAPDVTLPMEVTISWEQLDKWL
jgi:hypothetical protein